MGPGCLWVKPTLKKQGMEHTEYIDKVIRPEREEAYAKAVKALAGYKFWMFGYWAAHWVKMNQLDPQPLPNPFHELVRIAKAAVPMAETIQQMGRRK